jgi:2'-hydroxyisoflavone reductase
VRRRTLIIGGTGFIGSEISRVFRSQGDQLILFHRNKNKDCGNEDNEIHIHGDRQDLHLFVEREHFEVVIDTCAYGPQDFVFLKRLSFDHYIFLSSVAVYSTNIAPNSDETAALIDSDLYVVDSIESKFSKHHRYAVMKLQSEKLLQEITQNISIVRPSIVLGKYENTGRLSKILSIGDSDSGALIPFQPQRRFQFIDVNDLATLIHKVSQRRSGEIYNLVGPSMKWEQFILTCVDVFQISNYSKVSELEFPFWDPYPNSGIRSLTSHHTWISDFSFTSLQDSLCSFKQHHRNK